MGCAPHYAILVSRATWTPWKGVLLGTDIGIVQIAGYSNLLAISRWEDRPHADACSRGTQPPGRDLASPGRGKSRGERQQKLLKGAYNHIGKEKRHFLCSCGLDPIACVAVCLYCQVHCCSHMAISTCDASVSALIGVCAHLLSPLHASIASFSH